MTRNQLKKAASEARESQFKRVYEASQVMLKTLEIVILHDGKITGSDFVQIHHAIAEAREAGIA